MIMGDSLKAWCSDREAQRRTMDGIARVAKRLEACPGLVRLRETLDSARSGGAEGVLDTARAFMESAGDVREILDELISAAALDCHFRPPRKLTLSEVHSGFLLFDDPDLTIMLATMDADAIAAKRAARRTGASLIFSGRRSVVRFLRTGGATLSFWEAPAIGARFTAAASGRCRMIERRIVEDGETIALDGRRVTFVVEKAAHDLVYLQATTPIDSAPLSVEYDAEGFTFVGASSADDASSRTQMMLALLRTMDRRDAVPLFDEMLQSRHFFTRWQAMRELLALDADAGLPRLRKMAACDVHPEVRDAAAQTLALFFPAEEVPSCHA